MTVIHWHDDMQLGHPPLDAIHQEFVDLVGRLQTAPDDDLPGLMDALLAHARSHFEEENRWMRETGFPSTDCHVEQHDAVLASVIEVHALCARGEREVCRSLAQALADWFPGHATYLDSALAHWMVHRRFGGKPVVIHRSTARPNHPHAETLTALANF